MDTDFDLAANTELSNPIIKTIQAIVEIENNSPTGEKPALQELKSLLIEAYGEIKLSLYALADN